MTLLDQYWQAVNENKDTIVIIKVGDFWEAYNESAFELATIAQLTLTQRDVKASPNRLNMVGFPYHMYDRIVNHVVATGKRIVALTPVKE